MSRILFACYHPFERGTVSPLTKHLRTLGHESAFLGLVAESAEISPEDGPTFHFRDEMRNAKSCSNAEPTNELLYQLLPRKFDGRLKRRLCETIRVLHPTLDGVFPLRTAAWASLWQKFVESVCSNWRPNVAVLSLGQLETTIVRSVCTRWQIPCLYVLTPFYEFKDVERLPLTAESRQKDEFCVAGEIGRQKLLRNRVPAANISLTGTPQFDDFARVMPKPRSTADFSILIADQRLPENPRLLDRLLRCVAEHPSWRLLIRPHPSASETERIHLQQRINSHSLQQAARLSAIGSAVADDLSMASVVVSISSMLMVEARLWGIPAICWNPGMMPPEISLDLGEPIPVAKSYGQLQDLLDRLSRSATGTSQEQGVEVIRHQLIGQGSATKRVCNRILARLADFKNLTTDAPNDEGSSSLKETTLR